MNWMRKNALATVYQPSDCQDTETGWYRHWYFTACLSDAIFNARRNGHEVTLIYLRLPLSAWKVASRLRLYLTIRLGLLEREVSQGSAIFGRVSEDEFAICIENTDEFDAATTVMLIQHTLAGLSAKTGTAVFPRDAEDRNSLVAAARTSFTGVPSNLVYMDAYRERRGAA
jgi:GGDEF domain-containing protein